MICEQEVFNARVLIVDNLGASVQILTRMLASAGYTSVTSTMNPLEVAAVDSYLDSLIDAPPLE